MKEEELKRAIAYEVYKQVSKDRIIFLVLAILSFSAFIASPFGVISAAFSIIATVLAFMQYKEKSNIQAYLRDKYKFI